MDRKFAGQFDKLIGHDPPQAAEDCERHSHNHDDGDGPREPPALEPIGQGSEEEAQQNRQCHG